MRLWSLHPRYLDPQGLVALWREGLLAQAVLRGQTRGYRSHPQLERFSECRAPRSAISRYLRAVHDESRARGYHFDRAKLGPARTPVVLSVTTGQVEYEWQHLMAKLRVRNPVLFRYWRSTTVPDVHPLFRLRKGDIATWERP